MANCPLLPEILWETMIGGYLSPCKLQAIDLQDLFLRDARVLRPEILNKAASILHLLIQFSLYLFTWIHIVIFDPESGI